jgi:hypothetical protein
VSSGKGHKNSGNLQKILVENAEFFIIWRFPFPDVPDRILFCRTYTEVSNLQHAHQGKEIIAIGALENGAFCTVFSENFHKF